MSLKNRLKSFRYKQEMNQTEFAAFLGVNKNQYNRWENQHWQPRLEEAIKISSKLSCTVNELFYIDDDPK